MKAIITLTLLVFLFTNCKKKSITPDPNAPSFTWTDNLNSTPQTKNSVYFLNSNKNIFVYNSSDANANYFFQIAFNNPLVGPHDMGSNLNAFYYLTSSGTTYFRATSGFVNITDKTATTISGTFSVTGTTFNGINAVSGSFTNVPIRN
jgi:hypothetical protein